MRIDSSISDPGKFTNKNLWATWNEAFVNHLLVIPGTISILLAYIIRSNIVPLYTATCHTINEDLNGK